jgi:hypothetical protein
MLGGSWVVLIAGSTGSALRAVRPPNLHITPVVRRDLVYVASATGSLYRSPLVATLKIGLDSFRRTKRGSGAAPSADDGVVVTGLPRDDARMDYAARVLLFPDRATFAFLADFVATNPVSVGAAAAALLPELSTELVRISR